MRYIIKNKIINLILLIVLMSIGDIHLAIAQSAEIPVPEATAVNANVIPTTTQIPAKKDVPQYAMQKIKLVDDIEIEEIGMVTGEKNFTSFNSKSKIIDEELIKSTKKEFQNHPEFGILPYNSPCDDCFEVLEKRTEETRYFVKKGTNGTKFYAQQGFDALHYKDNNGRWRAIDYHLVPHPAKANLYWASSQIYPTKIDLNNKTISIISGDKELVFNKNLKLFHKNSSGSKTLLGNSNWSNVSVGSDGAFIKDIFPGIDMKILAYQGSFKTNFIVNNPLTLNGGWLVIQDDLDLPQGLIISTDMATKLKNGNYSGQLSIVDKITQTQYFEISDVLSYDNSRSSLTQMAYDISNGSLDIYIPLEWLNDAKRQYPVTIDPLVSATNSLPQGSIAGSGGIGGWPACNGWIAPCSYFLAVPVPANCTVTDILWSFDYIANGVPKSDGAVDILLGGCRSPDDPLLWWTCQDEAPGLCTGTNISIISDLGACVSAPQCPSYNLNFTMRFYDACGAACSNVFIGAASDWSITVEGHTVEQAANLTSSSGTTLCEGTFTTLSASGSYGVPGYSYSWSPAGPGVIPPVGTTVYTVTTQDVCGITATNNITITVNPNSTAPASISASVNPTCGGATTLSVVGGSLGTGASWYWYSSGCGSGFIGNGSSIVVSPGSTTTYWVRASGTCNTTACASVTITVNSPSTAPASISATVNPTCGGATTLSVVGGSLGTGASWNWYSSGCGSGFIGTGSSIGVSPGSTTTYWVRAVGTCNTTACASLTITVNVLSTAPTSINATVNPICNGNSTTLSVVGGSLGTGASWMWYSGSCGGTYVNTGASIVVSPASTTTYYVRAEGTCNTTACASLITITVNTLSTAPTSINATVNPICSGNSTTLSIVGGALGTGASWQWYSGSCGGTSVGTGASIAVSPASTTTYYVRAEGTCNTTSCASLTITVNVLSTAPTSINATVNPICVGNSTTLSVVGGSLGTGATWQWYSGSCGGTSVGSGASIAVSPASTTTYYVRAEGTCNTTACVSLTITVNTLSSPATSASAAPNPINSGESSNLSITGGSLGTGATWVWYSGSCGGTLLGTGTPINTGPLTATTTYYVRAEGTCNTTACVSVTVVVNGAGTICEGENVTLTEIGGSLGTGASWMWYSGSCGGTYVNTGVSIVVSPASTTTYYVRAEGTCNTTACITSVVINVNTLSTAPTSINATVNPVCSGNSTTLSVVGGSLGTGATWQWYSGSCGGTYVGTGNSIAVSPASTTTYYVRAEGVCNTTTCASLAITVNSLSTVPTSINATANPICSGNSTTLSVVGGSLGTGASWQWYSGSCGGTSVGTGASIAVSPASTTTYYVRAEGTCNTTACVSLTITVNTLSTVPTSINATTNPICSGNSTTLSVVGGSLGTGAIWQWYSGSCGGTSVGTGASIIVSPATTTTYYVRAEGTCNTTACASLAIIVNSLSTAPTSINATANPICSGNSTTLSVVGGSLGTGASWQWYSGSCGGTYVNTGASIAVSPASTTTYYVRAEGTCNTSSCASLTITVNTLSTAPTSINATANPLCSGNSTTLSVVGGSLGTGATWQWYSGSCGGTSVGTGASIAVSPASTTTYYVRAEGTCNNTSCATVTITVSPLSAGGTASAAPNPVCSGSNTTLTLAGYTGTIQWQSSPDNFIFTNIAGATTTPYTTAGGITATTYYRAVVTNGVCAGANSTTVTVTVTPDGSWVGTVDGDWHDADNWGGCGVPSAGTDVTIPDGCPSYPNEYSGGDPVCASLTINSGGSSPSVTITTGTTLDCGGNITINGTLTMQDGVQPSYIECVGDWTNNGTFTSGTNIVTFDGGTNSDVAGSITTTFYDLIINKTGAAKVTFNTKIMDVNNNLNVTDGELELTYIADHSDVDGNLIIGANGTLDHQMDWSNSKKLYVGGNWSCSGSYIANSSFVHLDGSDASSINTNSNFNYLVMSGGLTHVITLLSNVTVNLDCWIGYTGSGSIPVEFQPNGYSLNVSISLYNSGTITVDAAADAVNITRNICNGRLANGIINVSAGSVSCGTGGSYYFLNGYSTGFTGMLTISGTGSVSSDKSFYNAYDANGTITISGGGTLTAGGIFYNGRTGPFTGNINQSGGTLNANSLMYIEYGSTFNVTGAADINVSNSLYIGSGSTVGTVNLFHDDANLETNNSLTIYAGSILDCEDGGFGYSPEIYVDNDWINNGTFEPGNSLVVFDGNTNQNITTGGDLFYNLTMNNSSTGITLLDDATVNKTLTLTDGVITTGSYYLILSSDIAADLQPDPPTSASFVYGNLRRYFADNTDIYAFPCGNGTAATDFYLAELINGNLTGITYIDSRFGIPDWSGDLGVTEETTPYTSVSAEGVWYLDPNPAPTGGNYDLRCYIANFAGLLDNQFTILSRPSISSDAAQWVCTPCGFGDPGVNANGGEGRLATDEYALRLGYSYTSFSQFGIGKAAAPLPIELLNFDAKYNGKDVDITWVTASETNNDFFTVEKTQTGNDFEIIVTVPGAGNSTQTLYYYEVDKNPYYGNSYYRLKQTDYDGKYKYSDLVAVNILKKLNFSIYPNPATDYLEVTFGEVSKNTIFVMTPEYNAEINIFAPQGQLVYQKSFNGTFYKYNIDISSFSSGTYVVILTANDEVYKAKFVKK